MNRNGNLNILAYLCILGWKKLHNTSVVWCSAQHPPATHVFNFPDIRMKYSSKKSASIIVWFLDVFIVSYIGWPSNGWSCPLAVTSQVTNNYRKYLIHTSDLHPICPYRLQFAACAMSVRNLIKEFGCLGCKVTYFGGTSHFHLQCRIVCQVRKQK
jgi:hypothetical protein